MKKLFAGIASIVLCLLFIFNVGARITDESRVGAILPPPAVYRFYSPNSIVADIAGQLVKEEYGRGIKTRSVLHKGSKYFDYGVPTQEILHIEDYRYIIDISAVIEPYRTCMVQDFTDGYSASGTVAGRGENWACIVVTSDSFDKGEAYTVRDGIANVWGKAGGVNSYWGPPITNQYWIGTTCYQQFLRGYASAESGIEKVQFFKYEDSAPPSVSIGKFDYDWGIPADSILPESSNNEVENPDSSDSPPVSEEQEESSLPDSSMNPAVTSATSVETSVEAVVTSEPTATSEPNAAGITTSFESKTLQQITVFGIPVKSEAQGNLIIALVFGIPIIIIGAVVAVFIIRKRKKLSIQKSAEQAQSAAEKRDTTYTDKYRK